MLPDDDLPPLEPPVALIGIWKGAAADGRAVVAMPWREQRLSGTLDVIGFAGRGWYIRVSDPYGTIVWSVMLEGCELPDDDPDDGATPG